MAASVDFVGIYNMNGGVFYLMISIVFEVLGTISMKFSSGFSNVFAVIFTFILQGLCCLFLALALRTLSIGTAYAMAAGLGTFLVTLAGILCFKEPFTTVKVLGVVFIVIGVAMLHLAKT